MHPTAKRDNDHVSKDVIRPTSSPCLLQQQHSLTDVTPAPVTHLLQQHLLQELQLLPDLQQQIVEQLKAALCEAAGVGTLCCGSCVEALPSVQHVTWLVRPSQPAMIHILNQYGSSLQQL